MQGAQRTTRDVSLNVRSDCNTASLVPATTCWASGSSSRPLMICLRNSPWSRDSRPLKTRKGTGKSSACADAAQLSEASNTETVAVRLPLRLLLSLQGAAGPAGRSCAAGCGTARGRRCHTQGWRPGEQAASRATCPATNCSPTKKQPNRRPGCLVVQVYVHYSVLNAESDLLYTTWAEEGGSGQPLAFVLGKGSRAPRAWELSLLGKDAGAPTNTGGAGGMASACLLAACPAETTGTQPSPCNSPHTKAQR